METCSCSSTCGLVEHAAPRWRGDRTSHRLAVDWAIREGQNPRTSVKASFTMRTKDSEIKDLSDEEYWSGRTLTTTGGG